MFSSIKLWITIILFAGLSFAGIVAFNYYKTTQAELQKAAAEKAKLELVLETNKKTLEEITKQKINQDQFISDLNKALLNSEISVRELEAIFARHNLTNLANNKPGLIERRINDGTLEVFRSIECITGNCVRTTRNQNNSTN